MPQGGYQRHKLTSLDDVSALTEFYYTAKSNMIAQSSFAFNQRTFDLVSNSSLSRKKSRILVRCISSPLSVTSEGGSIIGIPREDNSADFSFVEHRDGCKITQIDTQETAEAFVKERLYELDTSLAISKSAKADIICFGEFAYPAPRPLRDGLSIRGITGYGEFRIKFEEQIKDRLQMHPNLFLLMGSYHCPITLYNCAVIFPHSGANKTVDYDLYSDRNDLLIERQSLPETTGHQTLAPILHEKRFPAKRAGEKTRTPTNLNFDFFQTRYGKIAILICSDVVDLNQFSLIIRKNEFSNKHDKKDRIEIVLIPSYNRSSILNNMCRDLSFLASTFVIVVNANSGEFNFPDTTLYFCGMEYSELVNQKSQVRDSIKKEYEDRILISHQKHEFHHQVVSDAKPNRIFSIHDFVIDLEAVEPVLHDFLQLMAPLQPRGFNRQSAFLENTDRFKGIKDDLFGAS